MGLDWLPMNKPKPGKEKEFIQIRERYSGKRKYLGLFQYSEDQKRKLQKTYNDISITAYETIQAPRVGYDENATNWAIGNYEKRKDKKLSLEEFLKQMHGFYVVDLVPDSDGKSKYVAMHYDNLSFRAQFLVDCQEIIGKELYEGAYQSKLAEEAKVYAKRIVEIADAYAEDNRCLHLKNERNVPEFDESSPQTKTHILYAAANWIIWWGERGHGFEADF